MTDPRLGPRARGLRMMTIVLVPALAWVGVAIAGAMAGATPAAAESRHASMIVDANTGSVLHNAAGDEPRHPASLTKMMTLYLAFEMIERGKLTYQSRITISQEAAAVAPSKLELEPGEEISLADAMKALVTKSANDIAVAIAERIGGTQAHFAELMTAKARQLGMTHTVFKNASGLPDPAQVTTARDMITLALHLQDDFPTHYPLFALKSFTYNGASYRNHNTLLMSYRGTDGIKTGYTRMSGFNLVASVHRDGKHLIGAIFGGSSAASRNVYLRALLDRAFAKASRVKTRKPVLVAKPAPAHRPKPQAVAAAAHAKAQPARPQPARRAPLPKVAAVARPAGTPPAQRHAGAQPAPAANIVLAAAEETPEPTIRIAKVRRIMVAPRVSRPPVEVEAAPATTTAEETSQQLQPTRQQIQPAQPSSPPLLPPQVVRGLPPSTLQAQASNLAHSGRPFAVAALSAPPAHLRGPIAPQPRAAPAASGAYQIQVGAYATPAEAEQRLAAALQKAGLLLSGHQPLTIPVQKGSRQLYRARFAGFTATAAAGTCTELRRLSVDCFVNKAE